MPRGDLVPGGLRLANQLAHHAQPGRLRRCLLPRFERRRQRAGEIENLLHFAQVLGRRPRACDREERLAHQTLGDVRRALDHPLELVLDTIAQPHQHRRVGNGARHQRVEESERYPPEGALRRHRLGGLDRGDRRAHVL
ncbi:MAG: hypothetical protein M5U08_20275 [Burkholderiales bacterium]|nr:hypothetical protein [Burkholderiales bacterium]